MPLTSYPGALQVHNDALIYAIPSTPMLYQRCQGVRQIPEPVSYEPSGAVLTVSDIERVVTPPPAVLMNVFFCTIT